LIADESLLRLLLSPLYFIATEGMKVTWILALYIVIECIFMYGLCHDCLDSLVKFLCTPLTRIWGIKLLKMKRISIRLAPRNVLRTGASIL
jgi:hypothetical protein